MLSALLARLNPIRRRPRVEASGPVRIAICPPALLRSAPSVRQGFMAWLVPGWHDSSLSTPAREIQRAPRGVTPLWAVRLEFMRALHGIRTQQAGQLLDRISQARSLRELWHLRIEVFDLVAHHRDQAEAHTRLAALNRHFPARAPRTSGFGALDTSFQRTELKA
jgi:hypothetical protein